VWLWSSTHAAGLERLSRGSDYETRPGVALLHRRQLYNGIVLKRRNKHCNKTRVGVGGSPNSAIDHNMAADSERGVGLDMSDARANQVAYVG
jgi:hypothetical protein